MRPLKNLLMLAMPLLLGSALCAHGRTLAVVVGIDKYDAPTITALGAAVADARSFADALQTHGDLSPDDVKLLTSDQPVGSPRRPTRGNLIMTLEWVASVAQEVDTFILYFAGHGISRWDKSYLLPVDANTVSANVAAMTSLALDQVELFLAEIACNHQIIIMDCCRNDPDQGRGDEDNPLSDSMLRDLEVVGRVGHERSGAQSSAVLFSCAKGQRAYERPDGSHGIFTHFLVDGLSGAAARDGEVTLADLCAYVEEHVPQYIANEPALPRGATQTPWHKIEGSGRIVLARPKPETVTPTLPEPVLPADGIITSHLGNDGPAFVPGTTPATLGWGDEGLPYPERFVVNPADGAEMVWVPAGKFVMGSTQERIDELWERTGWDESWKRLASNEFAHEVEISRGFWVYAHEVTIGQYGVFLESTGHQPHRYWDAYKQYEKLPTMHVSWRDAAEYANWAQGSLPTEAQWEYAAGGANSPIFPWGDAWDVSKCNSPDLWSEQPVRDDNGMRTWEAASLQVALSSSSLVYLKPVGSFREGMSWCGALDVSGSVSEWCADWYGNVYYRISPPANPTGPSEGSSRVLRGGSWYHAPHLCRVASRASNEPGKEFSTYGFRLVVSAEASTSTARPGEDGSTTPVHEPIKEIVGPDGGAFVWVPAGSFVMGTTEEEVQQCLGTGLPITEEFFANEQPARQVTLSAFWIGKCEVTTEQYASFLNTVRPTSSEDWVRPDEKDCPLERVGGRWRVKTGWEQHPMVNVNWHGAQAYCAHYGGHLPTEAQWEYAARGPEGYRFPWGDEWVDGRCCDGNNRGPNGTSYPAGSFAAGASWCGALDMAGNVYEWCWDWYDPNYYKDAPSEDPMGPGEGRFHPIL